MLTREALEATLTMAQNEARQAVADLNEAKERLTLAQTNADRALGGLQAIQYVLRASEQAGAEALDLDAIKDKDGVPNLDLLPKKNRG